MNEPQLQIDFENWLHKLSVGVESRFSRWFQSPQGECDGEDYCDECVKAEVADRKAENNPICEVDGWDEAITSDSQPNCARCGCVLECSPTREMIKNEIAFLAECEELDAESAWSVHNWLTGMGDFHEDEDWPKIKPHAWRLMSKAGVETVPDGFVTYRPAVASDWYDFDSIWMGIYEWYARKLVNWMELTGEGELTYLVDTSGVRCQELHAFSQREKAKKCIDQLLEYVGKDDGRGKFLASIGLTCRADMETPIRLPDQRCDWPAFDVRGRVLNFSPNRSHPDAKVLTNAELRFCTHNLRWFYRAFYDYSHHERSSWSVDVYQGKEETLPAFISRIEVEMESQLLPEERRSSDRMERLRRWDSVRKALETVFYFPLRGDCDDDVKITELLLGIEGSVNSRSRIEMTPQRIATLKRWIERSKSE